MFTNGEIQQMKACKICGLKGDFCEKLHKGSKIVICSDCEEEMRLNNKFSNPQDRIKERLKKVGYNIK